MDKRLCDILVYNRSAEEFNDYWNKKVARYRRDETDDEWIEKSYIYKSCIGRKARFSNSVIGHIHVFQSGGIDLITKLSIDCREKKYLEGAPDIHFDPSTFTRTRTNKNMSSEEILKQFNKDLLEGCKRRLKGRYIDLEPWNNFSKLIDWHEFFYPKSEENEEKGICDEESIMKQYSEYEMNGLKQPKATF